MRLLIIGPMNGQIGAASKIAMKRGGDVLLADTVDKGLDVARNGADLIMVDVKLDIKQLISALESERINVPVVACGIASDSKAAVYAIKAGAKEYVPLPPDADLIGEILTAVSVEKRSFIFNDPKTAQMIAMADKIAPSEASIMVTGESGTGKEVIARYIHNNSKRANNRFVAVNCAAIPENLLESELFGHEKGAFTGAVARRIGKFEEANDGTILLDEISEMDIRMQAKLLRVLQEREVDRIGGKKPVKVNVRVIATSNRDMQQAVKDGIFREDLLFRLNVVNLKMPALRERTGDIIPLAEHFIEKYAELNAVEYKPLSEEAETVLKAYSWQGNVRELENTMHRAVLLASGNEIGLDAIMLDGGMPQVEEGSATDDGNASSMVGRTVESVERDLIIDTLKHCLGNRTHAANILGISIRTLRNKLRKYNDEGMTVPAVGG
ncbi:MAG: sigma-54-dependent Fis family transcriptional regulator [Alphaproteobacteria bacterium]|nr:sigma-54-dependent Fis family transcriptional regulator [Alphaproteobacteria bacterium]